MISAILLAAGRSRRMNGKNKLVKEIQGVPLIKRSVENILSSSIDELIVVVGYQKEIVEKIIHKHEKVKFVFNKNYEIGMASSIKMGLNSISKNTEFFFICLGDMPMINSDIYNQLIKFKNQKDIIVPTYNNIQGNPVLFNKSMKEKIMSIEGDVGAKKIIESNKDKVLNIKISDKNITKDFDIKKNFINI